MRRHERIHQGGLNLVQIMMATVSLPSKDKKELAYKQDGGCMKETSGYKSLLTDHTSRSLCSHFVQFTVRLRPIFFTWSEQIFSEVTLPPFSLETVFHSTLHQSSNNWLACFSINLISSLWFHRRIQNHSIWWTNVGFAGSIWSAAHCWSCWSACVSVLLIRTARKWNRHFFKIFFEKNF